MSDFEDSSPMRENTHLLRSSAASSSNGALGSTNNAADSSYEELLKGSVPCPTCRGLGRVTKDQENQLVALIPLRDKRLKPRRTTLYVLIAVASCLLVAGLLLFFMFPRDVMVSSTRPLLHSTINTLNTTGQSANLTVVNFYNFSNSNFFPVAITGSQMTSSYDEKVMTTSINKTQVTLPMRSIQQYEIGMTILLNKENGWGFLVNFCNDDRSWVHNIPITFELTANYSYLGHVEQTTLTTFQQVECYNASIIN